MARCIISSRRLTGPLAKSNSPRKCLAITNRCRGPLQTGTKLLSKRQISRLHERRVRIIQLFHGLAHFDQLVGRDVLQHLNSTAGPSDFDSISFLKLGGPEVYSVRSGGSVYDSRG